MQAAVADKVLDGIYIMCGRRNEEGADIGFAPFAANVMLSCGCEINDLGLHLALVTTSGFPEVDTRYRIINANETQLRYCCWLYARGHAPMPSVSGKWSCTIDQHGADGRSGWKLVCVSMVIGAGMGRCIGQRQVPCVRGTGVSCASPRVQSPRRSADALLLRCPSAKP